MGRCSGSCGASCCGGGCKALGDVFRVGHERRVALGELVPLPGGLEGYCGPPDCEVGYCKLSASGPCYAIPGYSPGTTPGTTPQQPEGPWSLNCGPPHCPPDQCTPFPGGPCYPTGIPGQPLPVPEPPQGPHFPDLPGQPGQPTIPGVVTEQECSARVAQTKSEEEGKVIKYAAITAVVSGLVGVAISKVF